MKLSKAALMAAIDVLVVIGRFLHVFARVFALFHRLLSLLRLSISSNNRVPISTQFDGPVRTGNRIDLLLGERCRLGRDIWADTVDKGVIRIGNNVRINMGCVLVSYESIDIGNDCLIGEYVSIRDANHGTLVGSPMRLQPHVSAPIVIGNNVWIGRGAVILKGVCIGDGSVVAANSVVTRNVPPRTVVGGAPARVIKELA